MHSEARQKSPLKSESRPGHRNADKQVIVHVESEFRIETANGADHIRLPESAGLMEKESSVKVTPAQERGVSMLLKDVVACVDSIEIPVHHVQIRPPCKASRNSL
jgi:hypothetical protein